MHFAKNNLKKLSWCTIFFIVFVPLDFYGHPTVQSAEVLSSSFCSTGVTLLMAFAVCVTCACVRASLATIGSYNVRVLVQLFYTALHVPVLTFSSVGSAFLLNTFFHRLFAEFPVEMALCVYGLLYSLKSSVVCPYLSAYCGIPLE